jgi:hypothetical protein
MCQPNGQWPDCYMHDVFISYPRGERVIKTWVPRYLVPQLAESLASHRQGDAANGVPVWYDDLMGGDDELPSEIAARLARSRCLVAIICDSYFTPNKPNWGLAEWQSMEKRAEHIGLKVTKLVFPILVGGETFLPQNARDSLRCNLSRFVKDEPDFKTHRDWKLFVEQVKSLTQELSELIDAVPEWRPDWPPILRSPEPLVEPPDPPISLNHGLGGWL